RNTPLTGARPHMLRLRRLTTDRDGSSVHDPARVASFNSSCSDDSAAGRADVMPSSSYFGSGMQIVLIAEQYILGAPASRRIVTEETGGSQHSALCLRLMQLFPRVSRGMRRWQDRAAPGVPAPLGPRH